jgi:hypothetical protein
MGNYDIILEKKSAFMKIWTVKDGKVYSITYNTDSSQYSQYLPIVEKMASSFQITK